MQNNSMSKLRLENGLGSILVEAIERNNLKLARY